MAACFSDGDKRTDEERALVAFADTPNDRPHYLLARQADIGTTWGLAYSVTENVVYAAAYHKRGAAFGPGGPGAVYRVNLSTGAVSQFVDVPNAGPDRHDRNLSLDRAAIRWVGRTSLGDLDLNGNGTELFVMNLNDRRIYRFEVPSGQLLGSFAHGGSGESWADEARPFGLEVADGVVYHGVVRSGEKSRLRSDVALAVYASEHDGANMRRIAALDLDYPRGHIEIPVVSCGRSECWNTSAKLRWNAWRDDEHELEPTSYFKAYPMPMLSDIEVDGEGRLTIALRDRNADVTLPIRTYGRGGIGIGGILRASSDGDTWSFDKADSHYDDALQGATHTALGALAQSHSNGFLLSTALGVGFWNFPRLPSPNGGGMWFDNRTGAKLRHEDVCNELSLVSRSPSNGLALAHNEGHVASDIGDVEELCGPVVPPTATGSSTPTATATARPSSTPSVVGTVTASATPSPSAQPPTATITPTPTATAVPVPLFLPLLLRERCNPEYYRSDIALVIDTSSSMTGQKIEDARDAAAAFVGLIDLAPGRSQVAVVRYDREAEVVQELTRARATLEAEIQSLRVRSGTHIEKGLRAALEELQSERHVERNTQVLVLLTDGVQTGTPGEELRAGAEVRDAGVRVYAIGLGADVDEATLLAIVGTDERYYFAPDSGDLARIYREIAVDLTCPGMWGGTH